MTFNCRMRKVRTRALCACARRRQFQVKVSGCKGAVQYCTLSPTNAGCTPAVTTPGCPKGLLFPTILTPVLALAQPVIRIHPRDVGWADILHKEEICFPLSGQLRERGERKKEKILLCLHFLTSDLLLSNSSLQKFAREYHRSRPQMEIDGASFFSKMFS